MITTKPVPWWERVFYLLYLLRLGLSVWARR